MVEVILVDENDHVLGHMEKMQAHKEGRLHRAVSVCVFDSCGRWLLQRRAMSKYHSPGLLANTCCSHPQPSETAEEAAHRRLVEELNLSCPLSFLTSFCYRADVGGDLIEYEFDHLFIGTYDGNVGFNPEEVEAVEWWERRKISDALKNTPELFAAWFPLIFAHVATTNMTIQAR